MEGPGLWEGVMFELYPIALAWAGGQGEEQKAEKPAARLASLMGDQEKRARGHKVWPGLSFFLVATLWRVPTYLLWTALYRGMNIHTWSLVSLCPSVRQEAQWLLHPFHR